MKETVRLEETDRMLEARLKETNHRLTKEINDNKDEFITAQRGNEKIL
jgi:hypothetical protein